MHTAKYCRTNSRGGGSGSLAVHMRNLSLSGWVLFRVGTLRPFDQSWLEVCPCFLWITHGDLSLGRYTLWRLECHVTVCSMQNPPLNLCCCGHEPVHVFSCCNIIKYIGVPVHCLQLTDRTSVPNIWIAGKNVGGCNDGPGVITLHKQGQLVPMLKAAGALS